MNLTLITAPATEPITIDEAKLHLRVDHDSEDTIIDRLITVARRHVELYQRRALITQTWQIWLDEWPQDGAKRLPRPPLQSVTSAKYYGTDDTEYTFDEYSVDTDSEPGRVYLNYGESWPSTTLRPAHAIVIEYVAGYGDADDVPRNVVQAMLLLIGHLYENREAIMTTGMNAVSVPMTVDALLSMDRIF